MYRHLLLLLLIFVLCALCLLTGTVDLCDLTQSQALFILLELRLPEVLMALVAGGALSVAGLTMQTTMGNPLADPSILGVSAGASLGTAVVMLLLGGILQTGMWVVGGFMLTVIAALAGALLITFILVVFSGIVRQRTTVLLIGVMLNFLVSSAVSLLSFWGTEQGLHSFVLWGLGSLGGVPRWQAFAALLLVTVCLWGLWLMRRPMDALLLGERYAASVGHDVRWLRTLLLFLTALLTAVVTALCGPIAFVGLAVPHAARAFYHTAEHKTLIPGSLFIGCAALLFCLLISHLPALLGAGSPLPINILTPFLGVPVVLWVLMRQEA